MYLASWLTLLLMIAPVQEKWVVSWTGSAQGPYPAGNPSAQPDLTMAFPSPAAGAREQSFRLIVTPSMWGREGRLRLSNAFGTRAVSFDGVFVGLQLAGSAVVRGTNRPVRFGGRERVTVPPGESAWSDPIALDFAPAGGDRFGRKLAVSFHVVGESGPMTWHAKALQTSYVTMPGAGARGQEESEAAFPLSTTSWFFLDAFEMKAGPDAYAVVAFGDSITDGTLSTLNGDDRWPDVLARRLHAAHGNRVAVANAGIGGNQVTGPKEYTPAAPANGGPSAGARLERDVLSLSGVGAVLWFEGINDLGRGVPVEEILREMTATVARIRERIPGVRVLGATLPSALGTTNAGYGTPEVDRERRRLNDLLRTSRLFDSIVDFDRILTDPATGAMRAAYVHNTTIGGAGDRLHPNRLGYLAMGEGIALEGLEPRKK